MVLQERFKDPGAPNTLSGGLGGQNDSPNNTKTLFAFFTVLTSCSEAKAMVREISSPLAWALTVVILFAATESQLKKNQKAISCKNVLGVVT